MDLVELGPVLGTHIGPGFFGLGFYTDKDWQPDQS
jgi:fatty acid-binding protein DegV